MANKKAKKTAKKVAEKNKPEAKLSKKAKAPAASAKSNKPMSSKSVAGEISFQPLDDRVLVKRDEASKKTAGGLFIPDTASDAPTHGTVIAVGPGHIGKNGKLMPTTVKPGNKVMFAKYSGNEIKLNGNEYLIVRETDLIGVVEN